MTKDTVQVNRDVLVQVLEVLVRASSYYDTYAEIDALRAALEQQTEPVAWRAVGGSIWGHKGNEDDTPLYDHPPRREWRGLTEEEIEYPHPPAKPPVYATSQNTKAVRDGFVMGGYEKEPGYYSEEQLDEFARAVEALLKEKNK